MVTAEVKEETGLMRTLVQFHEEAKQHFLELEEADPMGTVFQGIKIENEQVYLLHGYPGQPLEKPLLWPEAAGVWEGIYRELQSLNR